MIHAATVPVLNWIFILSPVLCCLFASRTLLHYFQLESYQFPGYFRTLKRNWKHSLFPGICAAAGLLMITYLSVLLGLFTALTLEKMWLLILFGCIHLALTAGLGLLIAKLFNAKHAKKKFVITARVKRLYAVHLVVMILISWLMNRGAAASFSASLFSAFYFIWPVFLPLIVALSGLLAWPVEKAISECYFRDARRKLLSNPGLIRIGLTGSYGKTSVKHILGTILSEKYPTLITPASYNTPMGVSRAIRERLTPSHQIFVSEMGARHMGDIKELCRLVKPTIGIITSVGPQHLETFKTIERITNTKYELIDALPQEGSRSYFYNDGAICKQLYDKTTKPKVLCGRDPETSDVWCDNVSVSAEGSSFTLHIKGKGSIDCQTRLLGEHSLQNILLASAVASDLGLTLRQISHGISKLQPVKNRLELITRPGGFTIINDAFNSNPIGAKAALNVLKAFPERRIIITPGMVELGANEAEYNREFGRAMKDCVDIAIIVGKNRVKPIIEGLKEVGFTDEQIFRADSLDDSTRLLHMLVRPTDTVLYENDLPDHYQEA